MASIGTTPRRDRPELPSGYITRSPKGLLSWSAVQRILRSAPYLWIATTNPDGSPHLVQQWCAWVDDTIYFEGSDRTRWARNLAGDPRLGFGFQLEDRSAYGEALADVVRGLERPLAPGSRASTRPSTVWASTIDRRSSSTSKDRSFGRDPPRSSRST
jgi:hypothetical protein